MSDKHNQDSYGNVADLLENSVIDNTLARERIYKRLMHKIETGTVQPTHSSKDRSDFMQTKWKKSAVVAAASAGIVLIGGVFSTTSYAQEILQTIQARFHVGNMEIVQVNKERPLPSNHLSSNQASGAESGRVELPVQSKRTLQEARAAIGLNFPAPSWMADFTYVNTVLHGKTMAEVQYADGNKTVNFLISKGGNNGIETTGEVRTEVMDGTKVYFANGIVIWENKGFTIEMYAREDFDAVTLRKIINSFEEGAPLTQQQIDRAQSNSAGTLQTERAAQAAPAPAERKE